MPHGLWFSVPVSLVGVAAVQSWQLAVPWDLRAALPHRETWPRLGSHNRSFAKGGDCHRRDVRLRVPTGSEVAGLFAVRHDTVAGAGGYSGLTMLVEDRKVTMSKRRSEVVEDWWRVFAAHSRVQDRKSVQLQKTGLVDE